MSNKLVSYQLDPSTRLIRFEGTAQRVDPDSPALTVMTDLRHRRAVTVRPQDSLALAERLMIEAGVRLLFVIRPGEALAGLLTYRDLRGEWALAAAARERIAHDALAVAQVMTPAEQVEAIDLGAVRHAHVHDIIELLRRHGRQHALVTETDNAADTRVCGLFSATQISRQLGLEIESDTRAQSFAEIEHLIAHG